ncbi:MAG: GGDEF domain-containing protein [Bdellovibrionaceae bacterium]|nr:GGDEF domain-containing protein [Pseudobdellovibrionaceae bacterium]
MKQWVKKLVEQLEWSDTTNSHSDTPSVDISEDRATLLYILDSYNKHLIEVDKQPLRKVRDTLDGFAKALVSPDHKHSEKLLFNLRQYFSSYRLDEYTYIQNTFDDFKRIIWDFAEQLSEEVAYEKAKEIEASNNLDQLREAVETNSIEALRSKSREFIDFYIKYQAQKNERRVKRLSSMKKNLNVVKKQLMEANHTMRVDHLTEAYNRKSFDEQMRMQQQMSVIAQTPVSLITLDIDFFKKINDSYGHDIGDFILKECVVLLKEVFHREEDFVARIGGEEFAVILPNCPLEHALVRAEEALAKIRNEVFVQDKLEIKFTVSMGIAQLLQNETTEQWLKRADSALYLSKQTGRNKYTVAPHVTTIKNVA